MTQLTPSLTERLRAFVDIPTLADRLGISPRLLRLALIVLIIIAILALIYFGFMGTEGFGKDSLTVDTAAQATSSAQQLSTQFDDPVVDNEAGSVDTAAEVVVVYITGAVATPGLYTLPAYSRVGDGVTAAGGLTTDAAAQAVNLAQPITDGAHVHIPTLEEAKQSSGNVVSDTTGTATDQSQISGASALVNINTADVNTLQTLNGIGPATAQKIIDYRKANGPFRSKEDLMQVSGIGQKKYAAIATAITI
ncbi:MAG: ComEA family DNA-binding protein [Coriobacteriales bacterium]|jgi:competence protein ComEA|nr:ComEA family DNA-binding protein [Coriobacteriales bacterium]